MPGDRAQVHEAVAAGKYRVVVRRRHAADQTPFDRELERFAGRAPHQFRVQTPVGHAGNAIAGIDHFYGRGGVALFHFGVQPCVGKAGLKIVGQRQCGAKLQPGAAGFRYVGVGGPTPFTRVNHNVVAGRRREHGQGEPAQVRNLAFDTDLELPGRGRFECHVAQVDAAAAAVDESCAVGGLIECWRIEAGAVGGVHDGIVAHVVLSRQQGRPGFIRVRTRTGGGGVGIVLDGIERGLGMPGTRAQRQTLIGPEFCLQIAVEVARGLVEILGGREGRLHARLIAVGQSPVVILVAVDPAHQTQGHAPELIAVQPFDVHAVKITCEVNDAIGLRIGTGRGHVARQKLNRFALAVIRRQNDAVAGVDPVVQHQPSLGLFHRFASVVELGKAASLRRIVPHLCSSQARRVLRTQSDAVEHDLQRGIGLKLQAQLGIFVFTLGCAVLTKSVGLQLAGIEHIVDHALLARHLDPVFSELVGAGLRVGGHLNSRLAFLGEDADHATRCVAIKN